jgi:Phage Mu protein F like protein
MAAAGDPWLSARMHNRAAVAAGEAMLGPAVRRAVSDYLTAVRAGLTLDDGPLTAAATGADGPSVDWHGFPDDSVWTRLVQQRIVPVWRSVWQRSYAQTAPQAPDGAGAGRADDEAAALPDRLRSFPRRVWERLRAVAAEARARGESPARLRTRVAELAALDGWTGSIATMTRTEVQTALNAGALGAALDEQTRTRTPWTKSWLATPDQRTRPAHRAADLQVQQLATPFEVGGVLLQFPGDPRGLADQVINCRCSMQLRPVSQ